MAPISLHDGRSASAHRDGAIGFHAADCGTDRRQPRPRRRSAATPSKRGPYGRTSQGDHGGSMWAMDEDRQPTIGGSVAADRSARIVRRPGKRRRALSRPGPSTSIVESGLLVRVAKAWHHTRFFGECARTRTPQLKCLSRGAIRQEISQFDSADDLSDPRAVPNSALDPARADRERQHCSRDTPRKYVRLLSSHYERTNTMRERLTTTFLELIFAHAFDIGRQEISHAGRSRHLCS